MLEIMGHRGAAGLVPENTIASIMHALTLGVEWVEFDVRCTKDGQIVLVHDRHTGRIARQRLHIKHTLAKDLESLETKNGLAIPSLEEAVRLIGKKAKVNIEIKTQECVAGVIALIREYVKKGYAYEHFLVSSFSPAVLRAAQKIDGKVPLSLLQIWPVRFRWLRSVRLSAVGFYHLALTPFTIKLAKRRGLYTYAYTVNSIEEAKRLQRAGLDAIVTDFPDKFVAARNEVTPPV